MSQLDLHASHCQAASKRVAFVTSFAQGSMNLYHFVVDLMLITFMTAGQVVSDLGCGSRDIATHVFEGDRYPHSPIDFKNLWKMMFGPLRHVEDLHGCYRSVVLGNLGMQTFISHDGYSRKRWMMITTAWLRDTAMASWSVAFSSMLRNHLNVTSSAAADDNDDLLVVAYHPRGPDFVWSFPWNRSVTRTVFKKLHLLPMVEQVHLMSKSRGIISVAGAAFTHQFWMRPMSALFIITSPSCHPTAWHDTPALHLGHSSLQWRFCEGASEFAQADPLGMVSYLLQKNDEFRAKQQAWTCLITRNSSEMKSASGEFVCDRAVTMPAVDYRLLPTCNSIGRVGMSFHPKLPWSVLRRKSHQRWEVETI
jgi:hypothetical protein